MGFRFWIAISCVMGLCLAYARGGETRLAVTKDNSIVLYPGEMQLNAGSKTRIRIKGNQHLVALAFDVSAIKGRRIESAELVYRKSDAEIRGVTLSTIACEWDEKKSNALSDGTGGVDGWGYAGARFPAVTGSNGHTLFCHAASEIKNGYYHWVVDPDLIHANVVGAAFGLTIHEDACDYSRNPTVWSREDKARAPYLLVRFSAEKTKKPLPASSLRLSGLDDRETLRLHMKAPRFGFAYRITVNGVTLPRWNIPFVEPGTMQSVLLRDILVSDGMVRVQVETLSRTGARSIPAGVQGALRKSLRLPKTSVSSYRAAVDAPDLKGMFVLPLLDKADAAGGMVGGLPVAYRCKNPIYYGKGLQLSAARGETTGFQVYIKGTGRVEAQCRLRGIPVRMWRAVYVDSPKGRVPDPLVPFDSLELSETEYTPVVVDLQVPFDTNTRTVTGSFLLSDGRSIPVRLQVRRFALPKAASFACEMNSYGLPDRVAQYDALQRVAYDHRVHCNVLHYSHATAAPGARKCVMDMRMENGRRMNEQKYNAIRPGAFTTYWDDFAGVFGPYLTGRRFRDSWRGAVPLPGFYLTFHESWPLNLRAFWNKDMDAYRGFREHPEYAETFVGILKDFITLAKKKNWKDAGFQVYLNNKGKPSDPRKNPWTLDEPTSYWDYRALAYYADLVKKAKGADSRRVPVRYRIDISRPQFTRGQLRGKADLWVVSSSAAREYPRLIRDRMADTGEDVWIYGTSNPVDASNRNTHAWVLESYRFGANGVVPWQTVDKSGKALKKADQLGLFVFDKTAEGETVVRHSLRLKAYRRAEQDIEYLELLRKKRHWSRARMRRFIDSIVPLKSEVKQVNAADAGTATYASLVPETFWRLREASAALLESVVEKSRSR